MTRYLWETKERERKARAKDEGDDDPLTKETRLPAVMKACIDCINVLCNDAKYSEPSVADYDDVDAPEDDDWGELTLSEQFRLILRTAKAASLSRTDRSSSSKRLIPRENTGDRYHSSKIDAAIVEIKK